jgi:hypothetical protein
MSKVCLNGEPVYPGDSVYDLCRGPGKILSTDCGRIQVGFGGKGRPRQYTPSGVTGSSCYRTLYCKRPAIVEFPKDECRAAKLTAALKQVMAIFNSLTDDVCVVTKTCEPCETKSPCDEWR